MKYNKRGKVGINGGGRGGLFVYFDPNEVNALKSAYVRTKL